MTRKPVYNYLDYRDFIRDAAVEKLGKARGGVALLAKFAKCRSAFISQVLGKTAELSIDQAYEISDGFDLDTAERVYFLDLVQMSRAGTSKLRNFYKKKILSAQKESQVLSLRIKHSGSKLSKENSKIYYSSWEYSTVHMLIGYESGMDRSTIANRLGIPLRRVKLICDFLVDAGFATDSGDHISISEHSIHIPSSNDDVVSHHTNWRMKAIQEIKHAPDQNVHFSSVFSLSADDAIEIRENLLNVISRNRTVIKKSEPVDTLLACNIDLFEL